MSSGASVDHRLDVEGEPVPVVGSLGELDHAGQAVGPVAAEDQLGAILRSGQEHLRGLRPRAHDVADDRGDRVADAGGVPAGQALLEAGFEQRGRSRFGGGRGSRFRSGLRRRGRFRRGLWGRFRGGAGSGRRLFCPRATTLAAPAQRVTLGGIGDTRVGHPVREVL